MSGLANADRKRATLAYTVESIHSDILTPKGLFWLLDYVKVSKERLRNF